MASTAPLSVMPPDGRGLVSRFFIVEPDRSRLIGLARLANAGTLQVDVAEAFALEDFAAAYAFARTGRRRGKVVMDVAVTESDGSRLAAAVTRS